MEDIKIVNVKHPNCGAVYTFQVPESEKLEPGDYVFCETKQDPLAIGRCITPSFYISEYQLRQMYNLSKNNLKPVVGYLKPTMFIYERRVGK